MTVFCTFVWVQLGFSSRHLVQLFGDNSKRIIFWCFVSFFGGWDFCDKYNLERNGKMTGDFSFMSFNFSVSFFCGVDFYRKLLWLPYRRFGNTCGFAFFFDEKVISLSQLLYHELYMLLCWMQASSLKDRDHLSHYFYRGCLKDFRAKTSQLQYVCTHPICLHMHFALITLPLLDPLPSTVNHRS